MTWRAVLVLAACAGCGDGVHPDELFAERGGSRLALQKYRYDDGTEQTVGHEFYDTALHTRCAAQAWSDGVTRCVPVADTVEYRDAACAMPIGLGRTIAEPTHFVARDPAPGSPVERVFRAGARGAPIAESYRMIGGACVGPAPVATEAMGFYDVAGELTGADLALLREGGELGSGRLGLMLRTSDDGMRVGLGLRDRELGVPCAARRQRDGGAACEPTGAAAALYYADPACQTRVAVAAGTMVPVVARLVEPSGCASYHSLSREVAAPVYRRDGALCSRVDAPASSRMFAVDAPLALAALAVSLEDGRGRRLRRIVLGHDGVRVVDSRLLDTVTGLECEPRNTRAGIRCLPVNTIAATSLFAAGCTTPIRVAEVPLTSCERAGFATTSRPFQLREIGAPIDQPVFRLDGMTCSPYAAAPGMELRRLGEPLDPMTFPGAVYYGERAL